MNIPNYLPISLAKALQLDGMLVLGVPVSIKRPNDAVSPLGWGPRLGAVRTVRWVICFAISCIGR